MPMCEFVMVRGRRWGLQQPLCGYIQMENVTLKHVFVSSSPLQYGIVIDSGSSRSTVYLYEWPGEKQNDTGVVTEIKNCRVAGESLSLKQQQHYADFVH